jgi:excisionase family DNA binding protein
MQEPLDAKGKVASPQPGTGDAPDQILTGSQATKRLGIPLPTIRSLVRNGTLRATSMPNGAVGLRESEIQRFLDRSERTSQAVLAGPQSVDGSPRNVHTEGDWLEGPPRADLIDPPCIDRSARKVHTAGSSHSRIKKTLSAATADQSHPPLPSCRCGSCTPCQDAARWERVFQEKFADPDYYSRRVSGHGSPLSSLS